MAVLALNFGVESLSVSCDGLISRMAKCGLEKWAVSWTENRLGC